jgi:hypothetical protein
MSHIIGLATSILMIVSIGCWHFFDAGNAWMTALGMYGWVIVAIDCLVNIE